MTDADARIGGRYRLERVLASSSTGVVWQGWDDQLQRQVAIKQLHVAPSLAPSQRVVVIAQLMREARVAARVHHPNVVEIFDVVEAADRACLVMEYVPSRSLYELVTTHGPLAPAAVARAGTQLAAGLAAVHRAGIVHRDVKPSNMLVREDGTAKVTDFGLSRAVSDAVPTSAGMLRSQPAYLAPELADDAPADFASDVYSLGATLYMALAGRPPMGPEDNSVDNPVASLDRAAGGWVAPARSGPLIELLAAMMSPDPAQRPGMVDVANALSVLQPGLQESPPPESSASAVTEVIALRPPAPDTGWLLPPSPPPHSDSLEVGANRQRRRVWPPILAALLVIAFGTTLGIVLLNGSNDKTTGDASAAPPIPPSALTTPSSSPPSSPPASSGSSTPAQAQSRHRSAPSATQLKNAVVTYFRVVPGDLDAGWARLTPHFQRTKARNRQTYDNYWHSVKRVDVRAAHGLPPNGAAAILTYHYKDGRVVTQHTRFTFAHRDGMLKIDSESYPS